MVVWAGRDQRWKQLNSVDKLELRGAAGGVELDAGGGQSQVGQDLSDHHWVFDAGDDATAALAFGTDQNVDAEDAAHEFGPEQVSASAFAAIVGGFVPHGHCQGVGGLADDFGSESGGGGEDAVVADEVCSWWRHEGGEAGDEV